jgi:hypothetical protein
MKKKKPLPQKIRIVGAEEDDSELLTELWDILTEAYEEDKKANNKNENKKERCTGN